MFMPTGYSVGVVATEDDTNVESDGEVKTLNWGESATFEYLELDRSIFVTCSKPCLVTQYSKGQQDRNSMFMQAILPENEFSTSALFTTLDDYYESYLSLVLKGESPGDDLYLNGESLGYLDWTETNGYVSDRLCEIYMHKYDEYCSIFMSWHNASSNCLPKTVQSQFLIDQKGLYCDTSLLFLCR